MSRKFIPLVAGPDGGILPNIGKYHRLAVSTVFEMNGGVEWLADWAEKNPTDFFTKLYPKLISKEVETHSVETVDELLMKIERERNRNTIDITPKEMADADGGREDGAGDAEASTDEEDEPSGV